MDIEDRLSALATEKLLDKKEINMLIEKIKGLQLKKPIEVTVTKLYTIECKELNLHGSGKTKAEAIKDFKCAVVDIHEDFQMSDNDTEKGKKYEERFLSYFDWLKYNTHRLK